MSLTSNGDLFLAGGLIDLKNDGNAVSQIKFYCESSNAHAQTLIGAPHSEGATNTLTLPGTGGNARLVSTASTATLTNKTLTTPIIAEIDSGSTITLDATTDIVLDADGGDIFFKDGGTTIATFTNSSTDLIIETATSDKDLIFKVNDGGSSTEVMRLDGDVSALLFPSNKEIRFTDANESIKGDGSNLILKSGGTAFTIPASDGSDGQVLKTNGSGVLSFVTTSANTPSSADGQALGSASLEWSDLFLADAGTIQFGNDQDIRLIHNADKGLIIKHTATADDKPVILTLQTGETDMAANDVLGKIEFQAPDEGTGTDAVLVAAAIQAVSEGDFSSSANATRIEFMVGASEAAAKKMQLTSAGKLEVDGGIDIEGGAVFNEDSADVDFRVESNGSAYAISVDAGNDTLGLFSASATQGADVQIGFHDTVTTATAMGTAHANDATLLLGGANSGATQGSIYLGGQNGSDGNVMGAVYGFSGGSQNSGIEFLEGSGDAYGQIKMSIAQGTGGTLVEAMKINEIGAITKPLQPSFNVNSATMNNLAINTTHTVQFNSERFDTNADFNTSNYTFTAPVTGKYQLQFQINIEGMDQDTSYYRFILKTSNEDYNTMLVDPDLYDQDGTWHLVTYSILADMDANDVSTVAITVTNDGTAQADVSNRSVFSGFLVC